MAKRRGTQCCALGCKKRRKSKEEQKELRSSSEGSEDDESTVKRRFPRTFHSIPANPERRRLWLVNMNRADWNPSRHCLICSDHFEERCMDRTGQNVRVRDEAVPTRFKRSLKNLKTSEKCNPSKSETQALDLQPPCTGNRVTEDQSSLNQEAESQTPRIECHQSECPIACTETEVSKCQLPVGENQAFFIESSNTILTAEDEKQPIGSENLLPKSVFLDHGYSTINCSTKKPRKPIVKVLNSDHQYHLTDSATTLKRKLEKKDQQLFCLKRKLKSTQQKSRRLKTKVNKLKNSIKNLKEINKNQLIQAWPLYVLPQNFIKPS